MSFYDKIDFEGVKDLTDPALVEFCLRAANNRGQACFNVMAAYGDTTTSGVLTKAEMAQTYTLDADAVQNVLQNGGAIRGNDFLTAVTAAATPPDGVIDTAAWSAGDPAQFTLSGLFQTGATISLDYVSSNQPAGSVLWTVPEAMGFWDAAAGFAAYLREQALADQITFIDNGQGVVQVSPVSPGTAASISLLVITP